jgi:branched-chain amino acid aminotransferase
LEDLAVVVTFSSVDGVARREADHLSLAAAQAALPSGAYSTLRTYDGRGVLRLRQHLARLDESAALQGRPGRLDESHARAVIVRALDETGHPESRLRLTWQPPRFFVSVEPFAPLPASLYRDGVACASVTVHRDNPHAKDTRFIATASAAQRALPPGVHEGLLIGDDGAILEGLSSNFFGIVKGRLRTENERVLMGVTRSLVLEVAAGVVPLEPRAIARDELAGLEEAFITSVSRSILPVVRIDGRAVASGTPGPLTRRLMERFAELEAAEVERL